MTRHAPPPISLATRIDDAERHLLERRRVIRVQGTMLGQSIREWMTSPALLGSAVGMGFLLGNRTRGPGSGLSWLRMAVSWMPWMHTLFIKMKPSEPTQVSSSSVASE